MEPAILKLRQRGSGLAVNLPRPVAFALRWRAGQYIELNVRGDVIELRAVAAHRRRDDGSFDAAPGPAPGVRSR